MTKAEQARIFGENLSYYVGKTGKEQQQVAFELDIPKTTFNSWCVGKIVPYWGTIQKLAEYFNIGASELTEPQTQESRDAFEFMKVYSSMSDSQRQRLISYANFLLKEGE